MEKEEPRIVCVPLRKSIRTRRCHVVRALVFLVEEEKPLSLSRVNIYKQGTPVLP